ncbi:MAG: hypothetical protein LBV03_03595 [Fusobacteriales bacterium]|nr:hypothetical protein [Fusobacteriales bacterium]
MERNQHEIIVDVEKYCLDDVFVSDLTRTVREKMNPKDLGIYTYFVNDFDENEENAGKYENTGKAGTAVLSEFRKILII